MAKMAGSMPIRGGVVVVTDKVDLSTRSHAHPQQGAIDPTLNVKELVSLEMRRQDDLRDAEGRRSNDLREAELRRINEQLVLRAEFGVQLREAEAKRIDAIRAVDVNAVSVASERATQQANVLAAQVATSAETQRALVATTASTIATQLQQIVGPIIDRLGVLEKASFEGQGKSTRDDPAMTNMLAEIKSLRESQSVGQGGKST